MVTSCSGAISSHGGRGRRLGSLNRGAIICKLCQTRGHMVADCWYKFDRDFQPPIS